MVRTMLLAEWLTARSLQTPARDKASTKGFSFASADAQNQVKLRGTLHVDGRFFSSDDPTGLKDTWQATRVRPILEGTVGGIYDLSSCRTSARAAPSSNGLKRLRTSA